MAITRIFNVIKGLTLIFLFVAASCNNNPDRWAGGKISKPGKFVTENDLAINIYLENGLVRYIVSDDAGNVIIKYNKNISVYQNWAFFFDAKKQFWVFSSDVGHSVWKKTPNGRSYFQYEFQHIPTKTEVPRQVYQECREFFYDN